MVHALDNIFAPRSVALIGASEKPGVGRTMAENLLDFSGEFYPVNPTRETVLGRKCYKSVLDLPETPDTAILVIPARFCANAVKECVQKGIPGGIIISAGFKEMGEPGIKLEKDIMAIAQGKFRIVGPNCLGVQNSHYGYNGTFAGSLTKPGKVAFISQSGALCCAVLDWSLTIGLGFSGFVSIGSMLDLDWGDIIDYYGSDDNTEAIICYIEGLGDAESFYRAAKKVSPKKPIIVIKSGRTAAGASAVASHTGSLAGSDDVLDTLFERCGVLRVNEIQDLFLLADVVAAQPLPAGSPASPSSPTLVAPVSSPPMLLSPAAPS
ncbi:Acetyl-CoA synthetase [Carpediemonas membranifera]|uniref:Acetyl-CoA synthetase n=1 Tax=Carpediemonas membranifera TaxID=201153 RepID=A0A8J6AQS5_9EUKA|nr:Acetyl-CoA synthetase [Carpediemonas membranifera]|eukprot:KAG9391438.1 Acetyl-CoA synthetase [Carpediemonas membranifera]